MNRNLLYILFLYLFITLFSSCEELFVPKIEDSQIEFLVVDGKITNIGDTIQIRLTKAIGFNNSESTYNSFANAEKGAIVTISDDEGNIVTLKEKANGYYKAGSFAGKIGRSYTLDIKTKDGNEYKSKSETIMPQTDQITLTAEYGDKEVLYTNETGQTSINKLHGAHIFVDVKTSKTEKIYYKFNTRKITETKHTEWRSGRCMTCPMTYVYCWKVEDLYLMPTVLEANLDNGTRVVKHYNLGFIPEAIYNKNDKDAVKDPPITIGWLLSCTVLRISEPEYLYYSKLNNQLNADSKIFDPLPTQLLSNIKCVNDNTKTVLGYFSVSSEFTVDYYVRCNQSDYNVIYKKIDPLPKEIYTNCQDNFPPSFWYPN